MPDFGLAAPFSLLNHVVAKPLFLAKSLPSHASPLRNMATATPFSFTRSRPRRTTFFTRSRLHHELALWSFVLLDFLVLGWVMVASFVLNFVLWNFVIFWLDLYLIF
ncbi:hypothetical protein L484_016683 [Morus notabilis]|uniref:Uncharacterized protein n=1 Tax=Morus notabilis TaxID=981085 RepID=W9S540_9ROSA|nr:hypothetical protein L484_016683 [Morus notabilis]